MSVDYFSQISYLALEANSDCTLSCRSCNRSVVRKNQRDKSLSLEEVTAILEQVKNCPIDTVKLQGLNEPFLHSDFHRIAAKVKQYFPQAFVISATNLQYPLMVKSFRSALTYIDLLYLSIDGVKENYERLRSPGKFNRVIENLQIIREQITQRNKMMINFTASEENYKDLPAIYQLSERFNLGGVRINIAQNWNGEEERKHSYSDDFISMMKKYSDDLQGVSKWQYRDCFWPWEGAYIDVFGNVRSCLLNTSQAPLGNLWKKSIRDIFNQSQEYSDLRSDLTQNKPGSRCINCDYGSFPEVLKKIGGVVTQRRPRDYGRINRIISERASGSSLAFSERSGMKIVRKWIDSASDKIDSQFQWIKHFEKMNFVPALYGRFRSPGRTSYDMEEIQNAQLFSDLILDQDVRCERLLPQLFSIIRKVHEADYDGVIPNNPEAYYSQKLLKKVEEARLESSTISTLLQYDQLIINGRKVDNVEIALKKIGQKKFEELLGQGGASTVHGDFTAENILVDGNNRLVLIDPNNENLISSPLVDYAKLFQSFKCCYEEISSLVDYNFQENVIDYNFANNPVREELCRRAWDEIDEEFHRAVVAHLAVHFARLLPYQVRKRSKKLPIYYATLVLLLNEVEEYARSEIDGD